MSGFRSGPTLNLATAEHLHRIDSIGMEARRRYRLSEVSDGALIQFPDGGSFLKLSDAPWQRCVHLCGGDIYRGIIAAPHIDLLLSGHDLSSLEQLARLLPTLG